MAGHAAFTPLNPRTVGSCKKFLEAGIAGDECKMVIRRAKAYENYVGRDIFGLDTEKINIQAILPRVIFGMSENNEIFIRNWQQLNSYERQALSPYFSQNGTAHPGKSGYFIKEILPKGRSERRSFETFNIIHGLNLIVTEEGYLKLKNTDNLDQKSKDLIEFYFTPEGYAKMYFQNGFLSKLGLKIREHIPSPVKTREDLLKAIYSREKTTYNGLDCEKLVKHRTPNIKTNMREINPEIANTMVDKFMIYTAISSFLNEDLVFLGTMNYAEEFFNTGLDGNTGNILALTYYKNKNIGIGFNGEKTKDTNALQDFLDKSEAEQWIPQGCNSLKYFVGHEYAHALAQVYDLRRDPIIRNIELEILNSGKMDEELSLQAKSGSLEFIAESWGEYVNSKNPRDTAMQVGDRILRFMQKPVVIL